MSAQRTGGRTQKLHYLHPVLDKVTLCLRAEFDVASTRNAKWVTCKQCLRKMQWRAK